MTWDYIIIGAGSAGCVLANRLSADPSVRVLLIEAGGADWSPYIHIPAAIIRAVGNPGLDWCHLAEPDPSRGNKVDLWPAGRVLGGSSSINGMLFVRGAPHDYDGWASLGNAGWAYADVLPYFKRMESFVGGDQQYRGVDGPLCVSHLRSVHPLAEVFVKASQEQGIPYNADYNGVSQGGVSFPQVTQKRGWRFSASRAYLWPARRRKNLRIETRSVCSRLLFEAGQCIGAEFIRSGQTQVAHASRRVILACGAIGTPKILMLSGIGPAGALQRHGISVVKNAPEVGANLMEHPEAMVSIDVNVSTYNTEISSPRIVKHLANWLLFGRGPATSPYPHSVAFIKSHQGLSHPDLQIMLGPYAFSFSEAGIVPYGKPAVSAAINPSYPQSRGTVALRSAQPSDKPIISHALLSSTDDIQRLIAGGRKMREVFHSPAFDRYRVGERLPGPGIQTDDEWTDYLRKTAFLGYHPTGTCRMGADAGAVVAPDLQVRGVRGLSIADASIFPTLISGNTNAGVMMVAERAADLILSQDRMANAGVGVRVP